MSSSYLSDIDDEFNLILFHFLTCGREEHVVKIEVKYQPWKPCRVPFPHRIFVQLKHMVFIVFIILHFEKIGVINITFVDYLSMCSHNDQFDGTLSMLF